MSASEPEGMFERDIYESFRAGFAEHDIEMPTFDDFLNRKIGEATVTEDERGLLSHFTFAEPPPIRTFYMYEPEPKIEERIRWPRAAYPNTIGLRLKMSDEFPGYGAEYDINRQRAAAGLPSFAEAHNLVPMHYTMDPETEDVIFGDEIKIGMVVLRQDGKLDLTMAERYDELYNVKIFNRWCTVVDEVRVSNGLVVFKAQYEDGMKVIRESGEHFGWIVKKDSIPVVEDDYSKLQTETERLRAHPFLHKEECARYGYMGISSCMGPVVPRLYSDSEVPFPVCDAHHELNKSWGWQDMPQQG